MNSIKVESEYLNSITKVGVIADIQYCDEDDGTSFDGHEIRRYRESLNVTQRAAESFKKFKVGAVLQLGDAIDGKSQNNFKRDFCERICPILDIDVSKTGPELGQNISLNTIPRLDVIGNHELYCATREQLRPMLRHYNDEMDLYCYSKIIANGKWRMVILDSYAVSVLGHTTEPEDSKVSMKRKEAEGIVTKNNPNVLLNSNQTRGIPVKTGCPKINWFEALPKEKHRYVPYNGAIGKQQLDWLKGELEEAWKEKQFVVLFSHIPLSGRTKHPKSLLWDMEDVLELIKQNGSHVVACVGGHRHSFDYQMNDEFDTQCHHIDIPSPLIAPLEGEAHAILEFSVKNLPIAKEISHIDDASTASNSDENLVYHSGKVLATTQYVNCDTIKDVGIITVNGFGTMPKLMHLGKIKPSEW